MKPRRIPYNLEGVFIARPPCQKCFDEQMMSIHKDALFALYDPVRKTLSKGDDVLTFQEYFAILDWLDCNNIKGLESFIIANAKPTHSFRVFLAGRFTDKTSRKADKKPSTKYRNMEIFQAVRSLLNKGHKLTSSRTDGAALIVSEQMGLSEETVIKAYKTANKELTAFAGRTYLKQ